MEQRRGVRDWLMLTSLVVFWGSSFALTRIAVEDIPPVWVMALRLVIGATLLLALMLRAGETLPLDRRSLLSFIRLGLIGSVVPFYLISWSAQHIASGVIGITMALMPLFTLGLAALFLPDERPRPAQITGFVIGFLGLVVLIGPQVLGGVSLTGKPFLAQIAVILATLSYAVQLVDARRAPEMPFIVRSAGVLTAAAIAGLILALVAAPPATGGVAPGALAALVGLGVFPTALAALLLFNLLERAGASFVSISNYLLSPFAYFLGVLAMGEAFELRAVLGLAIILAGIYVAERSGE